MSASLSRPQIALWVVALAGAVGWVLFRPPAVDAAHAWVAQELPWLARLLDRHLVFLNLTTCWVFWRDPRVPPAALVLIHFATAVLVSQLPMNLVLGPLLALLTVVALVARPWPNRVIIGRCILLGGLAIAIDAIAH